MKTGIIRRIDDLGRIVIPKDIRYRLGIKVGDPLELSVENNKVCFERYLPESVDAIDAIIEEIRLDNYLEDFDINKNEVLELLIKARNLLKVKEKM